MVDLTPGVEKIKTLPYLVVAGLPDENPRHAPALAALARNIFRHLGRLPGSPKVTQSRKIKRQDN